MKINVFTFRLELTITGQHTCLLMTVYLSRQLITVVIRARFRFFQEYNRVEKGILILKYDSGQIVHYSENVIDSLRQISDKPNIHIEKEPFLAETDSLKLYSCQNGFYIREIWEPWEGKIIALTTRRLEDCFKQMKEDRLWDKIKRLG
jgi:hypothetical protein